MGESSLRFETEWLSGDGVTSPELAATWCRLTVQVGDHIVTRVEDLAANSIRSAIFCSAYPIAEWIATHWWALRSHVRAAVLLDKPTVNLHHGPTEREMLLPHRIRAAGDGFLWPDLLIVPEGSKTFIAWSSDESPLAGVLRFVGTGRVWAGSQDVQSALAVFVTSVIDRLEEMRVDGTLLQEEWQTIAQAAVEEVDFCDAAAALGLDPYDLDEETAERIQTIGTILGPELADEFAAAADPRRIAEDIDWVTHGLGRLKRDVGAPSRALGKLHQANLHDEVADAPWEVGWRQARIARHALGMSDIDTFEFGELVRHHRRLDSADNALQALASATSGRVEVLLGFAAGLSARRFIDGRALWRSLQTRDRAYLLTQGATFEQRVERAFAAELLAPASGIAKLRESQGRVVSTDEVERLAKRFKASPVVVGHQLENQLGLAVSA